MSFLDFAHLVQPSNGQPSVTPKVLPLNITLPLSALQVAMLEAAAAGTLRRSGWRVTIAGQRASVVTLTKLQDRGLVRHVAITHDGQAALGHHLKKPLNTRIQRDDQASR